MIGLTRRGRVKITSEFDKDAFDAWLETGSLTQAGMNLRKAGKIKANGVPYSIGGIRFAALRHYIREYPETRTIVEESYKQHGFVPLGDGLDISTINYAFHVFKKTKEAVDWIKSNGLYEPYEEYVNEKIAAKQKRYEKTHFMG